MRLKIRTTALVLALVVIAAFAISTTMADSNSKEKMNIKDGGPPPNWRAHPPIHIRGTATVSPTGLFPAQIRHAYGFDGLTCSYTSSTWPNSSLCGSGQVIAIVDAFNDPTIESDLATFSSQFGLPPCTTTNGCFTKSMPQGKPRTDQGWALEISLDVEWAHAIAPGAKILLVESKTNSFSNLLGAVDYAASQPGVHQVSMSWGGSEFSSETSYDSHFQVNGVSFLASSGDSGSILYPAASPYVVGVGGTTLNLNQDGSVASETVWDNSYGSSGGGISSYESEPSYQSSFGIAASGRGVPDVSYDADPVTGVPVYDSTPYQGQTGWFQVGGTSAGAPQWNALVAIVNSNRTTNLSTNSLTTNYLYSAAGTNATYNSNNGYRDITQGCNSNNICAEPGYDFVTGIGSPLANNLVPYLQTH